MKALVTGATGFLGGAVTAALVRQGHDVRALARTTSNIEALKRLDVDIRYGSVDDSASLAGVCDSIDVVFHCAGLVTDWAPWNLYYRANVLGVENMLDAACRSSRLTRFLHVSTTDVYGYPADPADETYPITDVGLPYGRSKGLGEQAVWRKAKETGMPVTVIRPADIYGPRSLSIVVEIAALLLERQMMLIDHGRSSAGLLYIDNAVEAVLCAAVSSRTIGQAYNLRDDGNESWRQFVDALASGLGVASPWIDLPGRLALNVGHVSEIIYRLLRIRRRPLVTRHAVYLLFRNQGYSIEKARHDFDFRSAVGFDEGMKRTLDWLRSEEGQRLIG